MNQGPRMYFTRQTEALRRHISTDIRHPIITATSWRRMLPE